jgi:4-diphosphocytidyl-2-C-methyl-D-erythritol kinase
LPVTAEPDNLVLRAIGGARELVAQYQDHLEAPPVYLSTLLSKRIPVAAGLGGGSSDAAAAIAAALAAWGISMPAQPLADLAASLGSDVPFFQAGSGAVVTGRGEFVEPLPPIEEPPAILLVTPHMPVSTAAVFRAYATGHRPANDTGLRISEATAAELRRNPTAQALLDRASELAMANDLSGATAATAPGLAAFSASLGRVLDRPICQSGSGPSLWVLYATLEEARRAARQVRQALGNGALPSVGDAEPFVAATLIATAGMTAAAPSSISSASAPSAVPTAPAASTAPISPARFGGDPASPNGNQPGTGRPSGPATIHNWRSRMNLEPEKPDGDPGTS